MEDNFNVTVYPNNPPKVKIKCDTTVFRPDKVNFDAEVFDPEGEELEYHWVLKHPIILGTIEPTDEYNTKSFEKLLTRKGRYVVELTVTDESGQVGTDYEIVQVQVSRAEGLVNSLVIMYTITLPGQLSLIWDILNFNGKLESFIDNNWFNWSKTQQKIVNLILDLSAGRIDYEPPIPKADLTWNPETININLSDYVNETGVAQPGAVTTSNFVLKNNDSINTAEAVYLTLALENPLPIKQGLDDEIEVGNLTIALDSGSKSNALFYNGEYTKWKNSQYIEKLAPGDLEDLGITIRLEEGSKFPIGEYNCKLFIYQEKSLDKEEYIDEIPFTIKIS